MTGTDWAYAPSDAPASTLLDAIVASRSVEERTDLLLAFGATASALGDRALFAATADNLVPVEGSWVLAQRPLDEVEPLDRNASHARITWHLALAMLQQGTLGITHPDRSVDEHAVVLGGVAGLAVSLEDVERFHHHEAQAHAALRGFDAATLERDQRALGALTARRLAASGLLGLPAYVRVTTSAFDALLSAQRDRDTAEAAAVDAAASRALAQSLGEQLERDEWIRARLRAVKGTKPARALIAARKRILGRPQ